MPVKTAKIRDCRDVVENVEIAWIPMKDGRRLAARLRQESAQLVPRDSLVPAAKRRVDRAQRAQEG